jgi:Spy/CpxP family protein refolding chaperone
MRLLAGVLFVCSLVLAASFTIAQPPDGGKGGKGPKGAKGGFGGPDGGGKSATVEEMVARMMTLDKNMDGKLTKDEVTDSRLQSLFERADTDMDGVLTKEELTAFFTKEVAALNAQGGGPAGGGPGGPGGQGGPGRGGPGGGGPGGPGGGFGPGGPPKPGQILPPFAQETLKLTDEQKKQLADLQKDVDAKLAKILTDEQKKQLQEMRPMGPGGPGGGPGRGSGGPVRATAQ